ncbi:MAG: hypothetical protein AVDCRST_MAG15-1261, partial [uncultured Rubellimicrobium sp.]
VCGNDGYQGEEQAASADRREPQARLRGGPQRGHPRPLQGPHRQAARQGERQV